ncbi:MAG: glycosyltransferase family 4 protein [Phycisphaerae bacterium]|nr:glycosyltransferase family 4 protein [Tepidisphaeraceae bacterium]
MFRRNRKIAVVHDFLYCYAGAERVLEQILNVYPDADLFALFDFLPEGERDFIQNKPVNTTFIQRMPFARSRHRAYLPLMPLAIEQLDLSAYDLIISSSYLAAKGVITRPDQLHVCYCHTPVRFAWDMQTQYLSKSGLLGGIKSAFARVLLHYIRNWDVRSANGPDVYLTNSKFVGRRIQKTYRRPATTVYPPVDLDQFTPGDGPRSGYVTASRLVPYKRIDLVVEAFNRMPDKRLTVIGDGPQYKQLKAMAKPNVRVLGHQPFESLLAHMRGAEAFVFAAEEDFGIVPVEAQACGTPVIAFGRGGAAETIVDGLTGIFFGDQTAQSLIAAVHEFEAVGDWDPQVIRANAQRFNAPRFREQFGAIVESEWIQASAERSRASVVPAEIRIGRWGFNEIPSERVEADPATDVDEDASTAAVAVRH